MSKNDCLKWLALFLAMILFVGPAWAEPVALQADFTYEGSGLTFQFNDASSGNVTMWNWNFGDELSDYQTSTEKDPVHEFTASGTTYHVTLAVSEDGENWVSTSKDVVVGEQSSNDGIPVASYSANPSGGVAPLTVQFTDTSTNNPTSWEWNFGDGSAISNLQNPQHEFVDAGDYPITFTATNDKGSNTYSDTMHVDAPLINRPPVAKIESDVTEGDAPLTVHLTDASSYVEKRVWTFGDGSTSEEKSPVHIYEEPGTYTVELNVSNVYGYDIDSMQITVNGETATPVVSFTANATEGDAPLTVRFTDTSDVSMLTNPTYNWDFGGEATSNAKNPVYTFENPGKFMVILTISDSGYEGYIPQYSMEINVTDPTPVVPPVASFTIDKTSGPAPLTVHCVDTSENAVYYDWYLNGEWISDQPEVTITCEIVGQNEIKLDITDDRGQHDIETKNVTVTEPIPDPEEPILPVANFKANITEGYVPLTVQFTDLSENATEWNWDFGDGNSSTDSEPIHTYGAVGTYTVNLTVSNMNGTDSKELNIIVNEKTVEPDPEPEKILPVANFKTNVSSGRAPLGVQFTDLSTGEPSAWTWVFGDGSTSDDQNPAHIFAAAGTYKVNLTVSNDNGTDSYESNIIVQEKIIEPDPEPVKIMPVANFEANITEGYVPLTVQFTDLSENATEWNWDFGDGDSSTDSEPIHTYGAVGTYTVNLTVSNMNGTDSKELNIIVNEKTVEPDPEPDPEGSTLVADFESDTHSGFAPLNVNFTDLSKNATGWKWNFGDNVISTEQNPSHIYMTPGVYTVTLTVNNETATASKSSKIEVLEVEEPTLSDPVAGFTSNVSEGYIPLVVKFTDASEHATSWFWNFGDGKTSIEKNPIHTYVKPGSYKVVLNVSNANGNDSASATIIAKKATGGSSEGGNGGEGNGGMPSPEKLVVKIKADRLCGVAPLCVQFHDESKAPVNGIIRVWNFGDGSEEYIGMNPAHTYKCADEYTVTLTLIDGSTRTCGDIKIKVLDKEQPAKETKKADIKPKACDITPKDKDKKSVSNEQEDKQKPEVLEEEERIWGPCAFNAFNGGFIITPIQLIEDNHHKAKKGHLFIFTIAEKPIAAFNAVVTEGKAPLSIQFNDQSTNYPVSWKWDFGDGTISDKKNPVHKYSKPGVYTVSLTVKNFVGGTKLTKMDYVVVN